MSGTPGSTRPLVDVRLETLSTRGGRPPGVHEVGVHVRYGEFFTFLGPPKSGKSDVLRAIAGFLPMTSGRVLVDGQDISLLPPRARGLGYVFQEGALWSHLTVAQHIAADALALSDRLAVMGEGRLLQVGDPDELYRGPSSRAVAETLGPANFLRVSVVEVRDLGVVVETEGGHQVPVAGTGAFRKGDRGLLVLRPETLSLTEAAMARGPGIPGKVALRVFEGARHLYEIEIGGALPGRGGGPSPGGTRIFRPRGPGAVAGAPQ